MFLPHLQSGTQIWVIHKIKELPIEIIQFALNLAALDFIRFVRIDSDTIAASSENHPNRSKVPVIEMNHPSANGIEILYDPIDKNINFYRINAPMKENGGKMIEAILKDFPKGWSPLVIMDWSGAFWESIKEENKNLNWINPYYD